jgi:AcrR family transcriptional regulator
VGEGCKVRDETKLKRHDVITQAAYGLLAQKGYDGTSMLSIAKAAKASNETLYRWYGDKRGLFEAMVRDNAADIKAKMVNAIAGGDDPIETLTRVSPVFLTMLLGERAILLNRAAASDPTGELGDAISAGGREEIQPLFAALMRDVGDIYHKDPSEFTVMYMSLLIGDQQIRRVIGMQDVPTRAEIDARCQMALAAFFKLLR